ncbi:hypothetical protein FKP32DRAFT_1754177 [Trametes sanguinea]|nr:hypothetical protein FKP32DRAFT_1754177 [Trametes sanguinea]
MVMLISIPSSIPSNLPASSRCPTRVPRYTSSMARPARSTSTSRTDVGHWYPYQYLHVVDQFERLGVSFMEGDADGEAILVPDF